jgi:hypothetical protein
MESLVEFHVTVLVCTAARKVIGRQIVEAGAPAGLGREGYSVGPRRRLVALAETPLDRWMRTTVTPVEARLSDPVSVPASRCISNGPVL